MICAKYFVRQLSRDSSKVPKILHVTARHSETSVVASATNLLLSKLTFKYDLTERHLFEETLVPYNMDHVKAKFKIIEGKGTERDFALFEPIKQMAEELNEHDVLVISTPMWNMSVPYPLKQYIDIVIQPGLNFKETKDWPMKITPVTHDKSMVAIYSCGANPGHDALPKDFLGDYLKTVFSMVGFTNPFTVRLAGVMARDRQSIAKYMNDTIEDVAQSLNKKYSI